MLSSSSAISIFDMIGRPLFGTGKLRGTGASRLHGIHFYKASGLIYNTIDY
jgi:hypothetical protein